MSLNSSAMPFSSPQTVPDSKRAIPDPYERRSSFGSVINKRPVNVGRAVMTMKVAYTALLFKDG